MKNTQVLALHKNLVVVTLENLSLQVRSDVNAATPCNITLTNFDSIIEKLELGVVALNENSTGVKIEDDYSIIENLKKVRSTLDDLRVTIDDYDSKSESLSYMSPDEDDEEGQNEYNDLDNEVSSLDHEKDSHAREARDIYEECLEDMHKLVIDLDEDIENNPQHNDVIEALTKLGTPNERATPEFIKTALTQPQKQADAPQQRKTTKAESGSIDDTQEPSVFDCDGVLTVSKGVLEYELVISKEFQNCSKLIATLSASKDSKAVRFELEVGKERIITNELTGTETDKELFFTITEAIVDTPFENASAIKLINNAKDLSDTLKTIIKLI
ncbi:hypothetical protein VCHA53O466_320011 [Vibrio chagasii]|nr:hypothetical protein VCHA53O466_320011 [Vibrio chagasii]